MPGDFVLPTVSVSLRSEAMAVQHHAFKKRSALCSSSLSTAFLLADTTECDFHTSVSDIECVTLSSALNCPDKPECLRSNLHPKGWWRLSAALTAINIFAEYMRELCCFGSMVCAFHSMGRCNSPKESLIRYSLTGFGLRDKWC